MKAGLESEKKPSVVFQTVVGRPISGAQPGTEKEAYIGAEAFSKRDILSLKYPIECGVITNWDDMEKIWNHTLFNELKVDPSQSSILLTDNPLNTKYNREKMTQIMFENFNAKAINLSNQSVLSLYSAGLTTGLVLDSGGGSTHAVPIFDSCILTHAIERNGIGGYEVSKYLMKLLEGRDYKFDTTGEGDAKKIKEKLCYVSLDFDEDLAQANIFKANPATYDLPDGQKIALNSERFMAPEVLFKPSYLDSEEPGIHEVAYNSIMKTDMNIRRSLYSNIVLVGGSTLFKGFDDRLMLEIGRLVPSAIQVKVTDREFAPWIGGSIIAPINPSIWFTREEFNEFGASLIHRIPT
ncbi:actin [Entomortierella beljakovae]|nr:actin [Entomortierella beljakovae]